MTCVLVFAQIDIEAYGQDIDFQQLQGLWRLIYTTALDVVRALSLSQHAKFTTCMKGGM